MEIEPKSAIVLVNTGTTLEPTPKEARRFIKNYLGSSRIAPFNPMLWRLVVNLFIAPFRGKKSADKYKLIWTEEGSPLAVTHDRLEFGLGKWVKQQGFSNVIVRCAMCHSKPDMVEVFSELKEQGCEHLIVLPLFPQSAYSTTGDVFDRLHEALQKLDWDVPYHLIDNYHDNATYARAIAASIKHAGFKPESDDKLVFAYHSIPLRDIEKGDTYELQTGASSLLIANNLGIERERWTIGYQSRFRDGRKWLAPFVDDALERYAESGTRRLFYVCPGFAVDCLETLYDIEYEFKPMFYRAFATYGHLYDPEFIEVPCLDRSKAHITVLFEVARPYLEDFYYGQDD